MRVLGLASVALSVALSAAYGQTSPKTFLYQGGPLGNPSDIPSAVITVLHNGVGAVGGIAPIGSPLINGNCVQAGPNSTLMPASGPCGTGGGGGGSGVVSNGTAGSLAGYASTGTTVSGLATGVGVITAVSKDIGTAGAPILFNGAAGTPTSINLANGTGLSVNGIAGLGANVAGALGSALNGSGAISATQSPTFITPILGTPTSVNLANASNLPISAIPGLGTGVPQALAIPVGTNGGFPPLSGSLVNGNCLQAGSSGTIADSGSPCSTPTGLHLAHHSKTYGAVGDGTTDDTTALQAWVLACRTDGIVCWLDAGRYKITSPLVIPNKMRITGDSKDTSVLVLGSTTMNGIQVTGTLPVTVDNIGFDASGTQTAGAAIFVSSSTGENDESVFDTLTFNNQWTNIRFDRAAYWIVSNSYMVAMLGPAVVVQNLNAADSGDSLFVGNIVLFLSSTNNTNQVGLVWASSGGLRVNNNKFVNGFRCAQYTLATGANTGTLLFNNNSCENAFDTGVLIAPSTPGNGSISKMVISGNEFLLLHNAYGIRVFSTSTPLWFIGLGITGNVMQLNGTGDGAASPHGIDLTFMTDVAISGNMIWCAVPGPSSIGILLTNNVFGVGHGGNSVSGCTTNISDSSSSPAVAY